MSEPIPKISRHAFQPRRFWNSDPTDPYWLEEEKELTVRDLVDFGEEEPVRLPTALLLALKELRRSRVSSGKAKIALGQDGTQKSINLSIRIHPRVLASIPEQDDVYEKIEGATTAKYVIHAHLVEQNIPRYRTLAFDDGDLVDLNALAVDTQPDEEEAWLLVSPRDLFWQNVEQTELVIEQWQAKHGLEGLPRFQVLEQVSDDHPLPPSGIELPGLSTRLQVQELVEQLTQALDVELQIALAQKDHVAEARREHIPLFEDARSMARRLHAGRR